MIPQLMEKDHEALGEVLKRLESSLDKHELISSFELLDLFWARLAVHIRAENVRLFPAILSARSEVVDTALPPLKEVQSTIQQLRVDHDFFMDELSNAVRQMRQLVKAEFYDQPTLVTELSRVRDRVDAVSNRLKAHNALEEDKVYGWSGLMLNGSRLRILEDAIKHEIKNLPPRFG
jgi:iron-sulfur cluster repair protein YtfE (RIC family)